MREIAGTYYQERLPVGTSIKFMREKRWYTVRASNIFFLVCTRPINMIKRLHGKKYEHQKTFMYTIVDFTNDVRGPENLIFGMGAETDDECTDMLSRLTNGESEVTHRNRVSLDIEAVKTPATKETQLKPRNVYCSAFTDSGPP